MKIIIVDKIDRFASKNVKALQKAGDVMFTPLNSSALKSLPADVYKQDVILVIDPEIYNWKIVNDVFKPFKKLQAVCLPTTSFEALDLSYFTKNKIIVANTPSYSTQAVAEYAVWMMLSLVRKLPLIFNGKMNILDANSLQEETKGKLAGIIGLGNIGRRIAEYCDRMGMKVIYWSRSPKDTFYEKVTLTNLLKKADFIFPCYAINKETEKLLNKSLLKIVKDSAYFISINAKTGYDFNFLFKRVSSKKLGGLAYESDNEWKKQRRSNIFTPPPVAWYTKEAQNRCYQIVTDTVLSVIKGCPENRVV
ncbi:MAG: NAD(P)-dependent oxidoreductase [Candidatus Dojkabacteria bacterium]|jgi:phosphoglycerate dehydrogenase-like enzyme|nr:NAD(P)-dependent oxidoreductase [Candidatus Dojkabacteria bacterium]